MKLEVNITKTKMFFLIGALFIVGSLIFVYAASGTIPNPGHALSSIQGYFSNDANLEVSLSKFCQSDGTHCGTTGSSNSYEYRQEYSTPGIYKFRAPQGVSKVKVYLWGGGGTGAKKDLGGGCGGGGCYGSGGSGAGHAIKTISVTEGQSYTINVGAAGAMPLANANGNAGGESWIALSGTTTKLASAMGGNPGIKNYDIAVNNDVAGGTASGDKVYVGGIGGKCISSCSLPGSGGYSYQSLGGSTDKAPACEGRGPGAGSSNGCAAGDGLVVILW